MVLTHHNVEYEGLLYPLMVIAAVAVIVFSLLGILSMSGSLPNALRSSDAVEVSAAPAANVDSAQMGAFACVECGVLDSLKQNKASQ